VRNLILTGGIGHPFADAAAALAATLREAGIESTITEDIEAGLAALDGCVLLTVYALRWSMTQGGKYEPHRERWGFSLSPTGRQTIERHVARGGGLLGVHTASICFDDWPGWGAILGGHWVWGRSAHPPFGDVETRLDARDHPLLAGLEAFALRDEVYGDLALQPDVVPLAHARAVSGGAWQPILWERRVGAGRVVYDALGHDAASIDQPTHRRLLARCARLAAGLPP